MKTSRKNNLNNKKTFPRYMQEKLAITVLVITLALFALVLVLYNLMKNKNEDFNQIVLSQQEYDSRTLPFKRGDIMDRNGTKLAYSEKVYSLIIDPKLILSSADKYLEPSVTALTENFGYDREEIMNVIQDRSDVHYVRYARQLDYDQKQSFEEYKKKMNDTLKKDGKAIKGITFEEDYRRVYPYSEAACHVIGFQNVDGLGGTGGVEQYYNDILMGTNGREYGYLNDDSNLERVIKPQTNGSSLVLTIDLTIQKIIEKHIAQWEEETGSANIGVVVMDPDNGEVLAMSSNEGFDLNDPRKLGEEFTEDVLYELGRKEAVNDYRRKNREAQPISEEQVKDHYTDEEVISLGSQVVWNHKWRNFCVSDTYEPGSPSKIFTVAGALEEGVINGNETFQCNGYLPVSNYDIKCVAYSKGGHGLLDVQGGLMKSCNVVMMHIAQMTGKDKFYKYQKMFGFGSKTGIDLPGEADTKSLVHEVEKAGPTDLATNSFGQSYNCTMIQMAAAYCSIINGGSYYQPHVVKEIVNDQGAVSKKNEKKLVMEAVSETTSRFINESLKRVVNDDGGTGKLARVPGYVVAGKTGTAEKSPRDKKKYVVSFAGYAPAEHPEVFVYVVIDEPNVEDQAHSSFASNIFEKIMEELLPYLNIFPQTEETPPSENQNQNQTKGETQAVENGSGPESVEETAEPATPTTEGPSEEYVPQDAGPSNIPEFNGGQGEEELETDREQAPPLG